MARIINQIKASKIILFIFLSSIIFINCGGGSSIEDEDKLEEILKIIPSDLIFNSSIINSDSNNPNGDGNGVIKINASAKDAVKFKFSFGTGDEIENTTGNAEYTYTKIGVNNYTITATAFSSTNNSISEFKSITVYVKEPDLTLVWSDEFNVDGEVDDTKWSAEIVPPDNQVNWWNGEKQHYTNRLDNVFVSEGTLKIVAKKENYTYANSRNESIKKEYTSARIKTQDKYQFTYGRIDVKAKLPKGAGTWPAIWMLGSTIKSIGWPACGEIDIMEHWGHNPGVVASATHTTACSGGCNNVTVGDTTLSDYATNFHIYSLVWTEDELRFLIDDQLKYKYKPNVKNNDNWPYTKDQFIILNVAMGGDWFTIDQNFTESAMEIDYVRVYQ